MSCGRVPRVPPQRRIDLVLDSAKRLLRIGATANLLNLLQKQHPADLAQVFGELLDRESHAAVRRARRAQRPPGHGDDQRDWAPRPAPCCSPAGPRRRSPSWSRRSRQTMRRRSSTTCPRSCRPPFSNLMRPKESGEVENLLEYDEQTAGRIMNPHVFAL